jgi:hypothetical protein
MRRLLTAALAGAAVAGGAMVAQAAQAQPYGYHYAPRPAYGYSPYYYDDDYYRAPHPYRGYDGYSYGNNSGLSAGLAILGSALGLNTAPGYGGYGSGYGYGYDPYDSRDRRYVYPRESRRLTCRNRQVWDSYYGAYVVRRICR